MSDPVLVSRPRSEVALVTLNRPEKLNAMNSDLVEGLHAALDEIIANSPFGVWMTKEVMWSNLEVASQQAAIDLENRTQVLASQTADAREAMAAFVEKRSPKFRFG